jgi:molybdenum cofactor cytidylyltransferase
MGDSYLFMVADQPKLCVSDITAILDMARKNKNKIIYPLVNGKPCSPTLFPICFREKLLALSGDTGGKVIRDAHTEACLTIIPEQPENFADIDTIEEYINVCK